jgi:hypothetical protein
MTVAPTPAAFEAAVDDDAHSEKLIDEADMLASLSRSIPEAAFRCDAVTVARHIGELRMTGLALVRAYRQLKGVAEQ